MGALIRVPVLLALLLAPWSVSRGQELIVAPTAVDDRKAVFATVESVDVVPARARIGGTVRDLVVDEGDRVDAGQAIAQVRDRKLPLELAALDARIASLVAQAGLAETEFERVRALHAGGAVSQARLDQTQTSLDVVRGQLAAARAERAVVAERQGEGAVLAPTSGRVLRVHVTNGVAVLPGEPVATIAAETYMVRLHLPERHARFLRAGDPVQVGRLGLGAQPPSAEGLRQGRIRQVYPELDRGRVVADAEVAGLGDFFVGERVQVYVATGRRPAIVVPQRYLFDRFGVTFARVKDVGEVAVQPGLPVADGIEILSGLRAGDVLLPP